MSWRLKDFFPITFKVIEEQLLKTYFIKKTDKHKKNLKQFFFSFHSTIVYNFFLKKKNNLCSKREISVTCYLYMWDWDCISNSKAIILFQSQNTLLRSNFRSFNSQATNFGEKKRVCGVSFLLFWRVLLMWKYWNLCY